VEFSWLIFASVMVANVACIGVMLLAQAVDRNLPSRNSFIPMTKQRFLYIQDFWTMTWGDGIGVLLITNAFVHLAVKDITNLWWSLPIVVVSGLGFLKMCLGNAHKPDYGFPDRDKVSFAGILHLFYFGVGIAASVMCVWNLITGDLRGPVMWTALVGGVFYILCFIMEMKSGNFDQLNPATFLLADDEIPPAPKSPVFQVFEAIGWICAWIFYPGAMAVVVAHKKAQQTANPKK